MALPTESALRKDKTNASSEMPHRHFATVAAIIAELQFHNESTVDDLADRASIARQFADALAHANPRFDRGCFLRACGVS